MYPEYKQRLGNNLSQYNDFISRAKRLSAANDALLLGKMELGYNAIQEDDLQIFTKWLITYFHSIKRFNQFYKVLIFSRIVIENNLTGVTFGLGCSMGAHVAQV